MIGQRMTADEFLQITDEWPRMELIDGEIVVNTPTQRHQDIVLHLASRLKAWSEAEPDRGAAHIEVDHRLDDRNVFAPDVWWSPNDWAAASPAIAVEVGSRSTRARDRGIKRERYGATGALEVWLVDTGHDVVVIGDRILGADDHITSSHLPGFSLSVRELFDR